MICFVTNANGSVVERRSVQLNGQIVRFDLSKQPAGVYLVKVVSKDGTETQKILIQK